MFKRLHCSALFQNINILQYAATVRTVSSKGFQYVPEVKNLKIPPKYENIEFPERRRLRFMEKAPPPPPAQKPPKLPKRLSDIRGPEPVHNFLLHRQYGIRALIGGQMRHGHFEMLRSGINKNIDEKRMFAVWRIDPPWKPITKKGQGHRMGSGKGSIDHYVTPVKAQRIIVELGGYLEFHEAYNILLRVAKKLPFPADVVSQSILEEQRERERNEAEQNLNPFSFEYCIQNNMLGCRKWASPYDYIWHGKYR